MTELGNVKADDLYPKVIKTLSGKFWIVECYKKNGIDYLHNTHGREAYHTPEQAIMDSGWAAQPEKVINTYA